MPRAVCVLLVAATLLPACGGAGVQPAGARPAASTPTSGQPTPGDQPGGYAVTVRSGGKDAGRFDLAALRAMPAVDVATPLSRGKPLQHGPLVRTVLARAGIQRFSTLRATGSRGTRTFSAAEIDDQVVLDFTNAATVKLAGAHLTQDRWVQNVTVLDVS